MAPVPPSTHQDPNDRSHDPAPTGRLARWLWGVVLVVVLGAGGLGALAVGTGAWQVRPVLSGSMRPDFPIGGVLLAERVPTSSLRVGDVAVLHPPNDPGITYVHRIVWLAHRDGAVLVRTKGIANPTEDPWTVRIVGPVSYEGRVALPYIGYAAVWVHSEEGRRVLLLIAAAALAACSTSAVFSIRRKDQRPPAGLPESTDGSSSSPGGTCGTPTGGALRRHWSWRSS